MPLLEVFFAIREVGRHVGCSLLDGFSFHINVDVHIFVGGVDLRVTEQVFDFENIFTCLDKVQGDCMAEGMSGDMFVFQ